MQDEILKILEETGMLKRGHFIGKGTGLHFSTFIAKESLFSKPKELKRIAVHLAECIKKNFPDAEVLVAPLTGGALLGVSVAAETEGLNDLVVADKKNDSFSFRRAYAPKLQGKRIVLIDDIVRTGTSLERLGVAVRACGGNVVGAAVLVNRSNPTRTTTQSGMRIVELISLTEEGFSDDKVPEWLAVIPVSSTSGNPESTITLIGVTGKIGSGKSTVVKQLLNKLPSVERVATSDTLRETLSILGLEPTRNNLFKLSKAFRNAFGDEVTLRVLKSKIRNSDAEVVVIDGVRSMELVALLKTYTKSLLVYVDCGDELRYTRTVERVEKMDEHGISLQKFNELDKRGFQKNLDEIKSHADLIITNESTEKDLENSINLLVQRIRGLN